MSLLIRRLWMLSVAVAGLAGCGGGGEFAVAPVWGVVHCNGLPVSGGSVVFSPVVSGDQRLSGKGGGGTVGSDGRFVVGTYKADDGAILGKHTVLYTPPAMGDSDDVPQGPLPPCAKASPIEVEVKPGKNELTIDLR